MKINEEISKLKSYAKEHGFDKVIFRNHTTNQGDFCIFLYNKEINNKMYCVGYDGSWDSCLNDFQQALERSYYYINNWKKIFNYAD